MSDCKTNYMYVVNVNVSKSLVSRGLVTFYYRNPLFVQCWQIKYIHLSFSKNICRFRSIPASIGLLGVLLTMELHVMAQS